VVVRRCRDDVDFGVSRYPYELGPGVNPFAGGYFEHAEWPIRRRMHKFASLRPLYEYEANYTNAAGNWMAFSSTATTLRSEALARGGTGLVEAQRYDLWAILAVGYGLRVVGLRTEFYKMCAKDPTHAKLIMPMLEGATDVPATDDLDDVRDKLDGHIAAQLMKAAASLHASNELKRTKGGSAAQQ
jgi:hypothetical protein